jgi:hypothetical protein
MGYLSLIFGDIVDFPGAHRHGPDDDAIQPPEPPKQGFELSMVVFGIVNPRASVELFCVVWFPTSQLYPDCSRSRAN